MAEPSWRAEADRLGDWWDGIVQGHAPADDALDPSLIATIRRVAALDDAPDPPPDFLDRLESKLLHAPARSLPPVVDVKSAMNPWAIDGPKPLRTPRRAPDLPRLTVARRWVLGQFATAALLVLTLVGTYVAFGPGRPEPRDTVVGIPGVNPTADTSAPGLTAEILLAVDIPGGVLELDDDSGYYASHFSLTAGGVVEPWWECDIPGFWVVYLESGTLAVQSDQPIDVIRASGEDDDRQQPIAANTETILNAGDGFVFVNTTRVQAFELRLTNAGQERVEITELRWLNGYSTWNCPNSARADATILDDWQSYRTTRAGFDPSSPVTFRLRRLTVEPDTSLPNDGPIGPGLIPIGASGLEILAVESGRAGQSYRPADAAAAPAPERIYAGPGNNMGHQTVVPRLDTLATDMTRVVRNAGDDPLVLIALTVSPSSPPV